MYRHWSTKQRLCIQRLRLRGWELLWQLAWLFDWCMLPKTAYPGWKCQKFLGTPQSMSWQTSVKGQIVQASVSCYYSNSPVIAGKQPKKTCKWISRAVFQYDLWTLQFVVHIISWNGTKCYFFILISIKNLITPFSLRAIQRLWARVGPWTAVCWPLLWGMIYQGLGPGGHYTNKRSQTQRDKHCMIWLLSGI